jgi:hypothetical protein
MKQGGNKQSPSTQPHKGEDLYKMGCGLVSQETYSGTKFYFQYPFF